VKPAHTETVPVRVQVEP
ncbi:hypothetical protein MKD33_06880, partial [Chromobacterium piscinae]